MRVAVVDIGTNSTRLLIADVDGQGQVKEVDRRSEVTRLGHGVDAAGSLAPEAIQRVLDTLQGYREAIDAHACEVSTAVLTSAVRDAANGSQLTDRVRTDYDIPARMIDGDEEAQLTFLGAMSERDPTDMKPTLVIDIGGGSTELVVGSGRRVSFHVSLQAGVVRQSERHISTDPPASEELQALAAEVRALIGDQVPVELRRSVARGIAVAGTPTSLAAIAQELDPYDSDRVHGYVLQEGTCELLLARLAAMSEAERRQVVGLDPQRAPTIVAGSVMLLEVMRAFGLDHVEVSEHDILRGSALRAAGVAWAPRGRLTEHPAPSPPAS